MKYILVVWLVLVAMVGVGVADDSIVVVPAIDDVMVEVISEDGAWSATAGTVEWATLDGEIAFSVPGDITIEGLFNQDCKMIGWNKKTEKLVCYEYSKKITSKGEGKVFSFLFGWMGSLIFWVVFFAISFFAGTMFIKAKAPETLRFITSKTKRERCNGDDTFVFFLLIILIYLFWPLLLIALIVGFVFKRIVWGIFSKLFKYTVDNAPTISFDKKPESE